MIRDTGRPLFSFAIIADTHITDEEARAIDGSYQTAKKAGVPDSMVETVLGQIEDGLPAAIESASAALPKNFPTELRDSIAVGALKRCKVITAAVA